VVDGLKTSKFNYLTPLHFKGLAVFNLILENSTKVSGVKTVKLQYFGLVVWKKDTIHKTIRNQEQS